MTTHRFARPWPVHVLVAVLLAVVVFRGGAVAAGAFAAVYALGVVTPPRWWLPAVTAAWAGVLVVSPDGVWLAFPLFLLQAHLLPRAAGLPAVAATTVVAVTGFAWHRGEFTVAAVVGPTLGAVVTVAGVLGYQALYRESERRRQLIDQLETTRASLAAAERERGVLGERERLAREIHDTLAQGLSSIQLLLRAAARSLPDDPETAAGHVEQARATAQDNLAEARRFVHALTPPDLAGKSLPAALRRLCEGTRELPATLHVDGTPVPLPTAHEVALLRVAQSAVANAVRHARAGHADLTLSYMEDRVTLDVVDDGVGFDPDAVRASGGFGLVAMRARVAELGGSLVVESAPGQGTALAVSFPRAEP
ncbi:hypothetical protein SUDANB95_04647 [Actinosynnema sp. ALI-1.44]